MDPGSASRRPDSLVTGTNRTCMNVKSADCAGQRMSPGAGFEIPNLGDWKLSSSLHAAPDPTSGAPNTGNFLVEGSEYLICIMRSADRYKQ